MNNIKIIITEPTEIENTKSVGCFFIEDSIRKSGYNIKYVEFEKLKDETADIILFSIHHVKDLFYLAKLYKYKKNIWIGGGHVMNNPYPFLHFFDIICVGEGEEWIIKILDIIQEYGIENINEIIKKCSFIPGTLTKYNLDENIEKIYLNDISNNNIYLNKSFSKGHDDTWYIEIARGCKSKCAYCELGWTTKYRENNKEKVFQLIDSIKTSDIKKINIFAPDDFSCSFYEDCINFIFKNNLQTNFGSMRIDRFNNLSLKHKKNFLFRMGLDGLSEEIRDIILKKNTNEKLINLISDMAYKNFVMFKLFLIFSYPFEKETDWYEFESVIQKLKIKLNKIKRPIFLRIKFTPFIPNLLTPLEDFKPYYDIKMREKIELFFLKNKMQRSKIVIINDGILEPYSYYTQSFLARCNFEDIDINLLSDRKTLNFLAEEKVKNSFPKRKIKTYINPNILQKSKNKIYKKIEDYKRCIR
ncbi:MAG TPA: hypothetical protein PLU67_08220 [Candidatus Kapabacteria bacterium]|nr:hypothetical protein [Candidatus Kapabacteria bacterium]